jgi:hypothetical protein
VTLSDGAIRNAYDIRLRNKHGQARVFEFQIVGDPALELRLEGQDGDETLVPADETLLQRVYVTAAPGTDPAGSDRTELRFWVQDSVSGERVYQDSLFNGKGSE